MWNKKSYYFSLNLRKEFKYRMIFFKQTWRSRKYIGPLASHVQSEQLFNIFECICVLYPTSLRIEQLD